MYHKRANVKNFSEDERSMGTIKYIVLHYDGNNGATARNNVDYFARAGVGASAHYFIDENEIALSVPWYYTAWHCGAMKYTHPDCRNHNSIGIELCSKRYKDGAYYFEPNTVIRAASLVRSLMETFQIPLKNVVRHYDVTGKNCPAPWVDNNEWGEFLRLVEDKPKEVNTMKYYEKVVEIPQGEQREVVNKLVERGIIKGTSNGLHLSEDMVRILTYLDRTGIFK